MTAERGWYYADGDPPGTVRLWSGNDWIGFPQRDPNIPLTAERIELGPARGQQRLWPWGILATIGLIAPGLAYLFQAFVLFRWTGVVDDLSGRSFATVTEVEETLYLVEDEVALQLAALIGLGLGVAFAGLLFIPWFFVAYQNVGRWAQTRYESWWAILAWLIPFINLRRPSHIMQEICELSPRADRPGAVNPVVAWAWWLIFVTSGFAIRMLQAWAIRSTDAVTIEMILWISVILCLANVLAVGLAMRLVHQISYHQDLRFRRTTMAGDTIALATV